MAAHSLLGVRPSLLDNFGGVGGAVAPLTAIVSGGFADGAGRFPRAENIPCAEERP